MDKITFLQRLQRERDAFELLLNQVGFARQMTMKGVWHDLSVKDLLADILAREQFIADRLSGIIHQEPYSPCASHSALDHFQEKCGYPDYESMLVDKDEINHLVVYKYKNIGLDDIIEQELAAYVSIVAALEKIARAQCLDYDVFHRVGEQTFKQYRRMIQRIHRWRESISSGEK